MSNLVGWWPLHETQGQAQDLSGQGNHGNNIDDPERGMAGREGLTSIKFDGQTNDAVFLDNLNQTFKDTQNQGTLTGWMKLQANDEANLFATGTSDSSNGTDSGTRLRIQVQPDKYAIRVYEGTNLDADPTKITTKKWHQVTITWNQSGRKMYIDSELVGTDNISPLNDSGTSGYDGYIAKNPYDIQNSNSTAPVNLNDVRIYNRALTPQEIQKLYQWGSQDYTNPKYHNGNDNGAVSRFKFNGSISDTWGTVSDSDVSDNTSAGYGNGIRGKAKKFDGTDDYIELSEISLGDNENFTVTAWFKTPSPSEWPRILQQDRNSGSNAGFALATDGDGSGSYYPVFVHSTSDGNTTNDYTTSKPIVSDSWYFICGVYKGEPKLYLNGAFAGGESSGEWGKLGDNANGGLRIGSKTDDTVHTWNGKIDDVRIYERALNPWEVHQLYQWGTKGRDLRKLTVNSKGDR